MYSTSDFRKGLKIKFKDEPYVIVEFQHVKPGKGGAFVRTKLKNMITGRVLDETFRSGEKVERPDVEEKEMQYLYQGQEGFCFMDNNTYEQIFMDEDHVGDQKYFLQENINLKVLFYNGQPIGLDFPTTVNLTVIKSDPGIKGDTATGATKPAALETNLVVQVPLFINEGDVLKIDTRSGEYIERVKS